MYFRAALQSAESPGLINPNDLGAMPCAKIGLSTRAETQQGVREEVPLKPCTVAVLPTGDGFCARRLPYAPPSSSGRTDLSTFLRSAGPTLAFVPPTSMTRMRIVTRIRAPTLGQHTADPTRRLAAVRPRRWHRNDAASLRQVESGSTISTARGLRPLNKTSMRARVSGQLPRVRTQGSEISWPRRTVAP